MTRRLQTRSRRCLLISTLHPRRHSPPHLLPVNRRLRTRSKLPSPISISSRVRGPAPSGGRFRRCVWHFSACSFGYLGRTRLSRDSSIGSFWARSVRWQQPSKARSESGALWCERSSNGWWGLRRPLSAAETGEERSVRTIESLVESEAAAQIERQDRQRANEYRLNALEADLGRLSTATAVLQGEASTIETVTARLDTVATAVKMATAGLVLIPR